MKPHLIYSLRNERDTTRVNLTAFVIFLFPKLCDMPGQAFVVAEREETKGLRPHKIAADDRSGIVVDKEQNAIVPNKWAVKRIVAERRHVHQVPIERAPNGVVVGHKVARARNVSNESVMKHPTELDVTAAQLGFTGCVIEASAWLAPSFRAMGHKANRLAANGASKRTDSFFEVNAVGHGEFR